MISEAIRYFPRCDVCLTAIPEQPQVDRELARDVAKAYKWFVWGNQDICGSCIEDRACRIFGHDNGVDPYCLRCLREC